jgi:hypothetical protein
VVVGVIIVITIILLIYKKFKKNEQGANLRELEW